MPGQSRRRRGQADPAGVEEGDTSTHEIQQVWTAPPPPVLPRFNGDEPVDNFIAEARRAVLAYHFKGPAATEFIIRHLDGPARIEALNRNPTTPENLFHVLEDVFGDHRDLQSLLHSFHSRRQGIAEGILEYSHALQAVASRVRKLSPNILTPEMLRDKFVDGLQPPALRKDVKFIRDNEGCDLLQLRAECFVSCM